MRKKYTAHLSALMALAALFIMCTCSFAGTPNWSAQQKNTAMDQAATATLVLGFNAAVSAITQEATIEATANTVQAMTQAQQAAISQTQADVGTEAAANAATIAPAIDETQTNATANMEVADANSIAGIAAHTAPCAAYTYLNAG